MLSPIKTTHLIVGAGISGLTLAQRLQHFDCLVLEKSKGVGGRMATRRIESEFFDHGAQFYKTSKIKKNYWDTFWSEQKKAQMWFKKDLIKYKVGTNGMAHLAKSLVIANQLILNEKVFKIMNNTNYIELQTESGQRYHADYLYLSSPLPQSLEILNLSNISYRTELDHIKYAKALVGLFQTQGNFKIDHVKNFQDNCNDHIFSISRQNSKVKSLESTFVVVMQPIWSESYYDLSDVQILEKITSIFSQYLIENSELADLNFKFSQLKKWRYSHPINPMTSGFEKISERLFLFGDAFFGKSILSAINSALSIPVKNI